jgi:protoheme IX farnesyltransferase
MLTEKTNPYPLTKPTVIASAGQKLKDYIQLGKLRLSLTVVFSAGMAYLIASDQPTNWGTFVALLIGGLLITLSANAINQMLEVPFDALMKRTANRPLPAGRMLATEAMLYAIFTGLIGVLTLMIGVSYLSGVLGLISLLMYAFLYTPMKRTSPLAVFVGGIPGALPVVIGWSGATGRLDTGAWALFAIQFFWQLPHFWAIAWVAYEDYTRAGYRLMPSGGERNRRSATEICLYTLPLIPIAFLPQYLGIAGTGATITLVAISVIYLLQTVLLWVKLSRKAALGVMFGSFLYLPAALIALLADKI